jgi:hypothetical protein
MVKTFCKIVPSGRCAKTQNKNEDDSNCIFNTTTNRCNKSGPKKKVRIVKNATPSKKIDSTKKSKPKGVHKQLSTINFQLSNDAKSIEFSQISEKFCLRNQFNSIEDLNAIMKHLKLPKMKSKSQMFLKIKEYISTELHKFPLKKISLDTFELNTPSHQSIVYQYGQCKTITLYGITLLLLYFNIYETVSTIKKNALCKIIDSKLPVNKKQIEKHFFQKLSNIKNCNSLPVKEIDKILSSLNIEKTKATKQDKCSIILNIEKLYKADISKPYLILDDQNILFMTKPKKFLYNIHHNILSPSELWQIVKHLQSFGLIPNQIYKMPIVTINDHNKVIKNAILTKQNFPNYQFPLQLKVIPKTPSKTPSLSEQHYLSHETFLQLSKKMNHCISAYQKPFESGKYKLIDLVPPENILENGKDIRMYHGTKVLHWDDIKQNGIKPVGGGTLGKGFYFTPSVERATHYLFVKKPAQKKKLEPVLIELTIKNANILTVGNLNSNFPIKTNDKLPFKTNFYWQFIVDSNEIIDKHFRMYRVFKLDV